MRRIRWPRTGLELTLVFLVLVLLPSFLLGYFSLRAVESEKQARQRRLQEDQQRYAGIAARALRHELDGLQSAWRELVPVRVGWEGRIPEIAAALEPGRLGDRFVRTAWILDASGDLLYPLVEDPAGAARRAAQRVAPSPAESRLFEDLVARGEAAEFDRGDAGEAVRAYGEILRRVESPRLRAIAHAALGRAELRRGAWDAALQQYRTLLENYPQSLDLDNQPLRYLAQLQIARALEEKGDVAEAAAGLLRLHDDLVQSSDEIGAMQFELFTERIEEQMGRLLAQPGASEELRARWEGRGARAKKPAGESFYVNKLARKLTRAVMDEQPYSPRLRYVSDVADGRPFLLAYVLLPDPTETRVTGLLGLDVDLEKMSAALLPQLLRRLEFSDELRLAVVDETGHVVIGEPGAGGAPAAVQSNLGEPFEFWNVAVESRAPGELQRAVDFRTKVFLYLILLLLLTILAGAGLVALAVRRQARLANLKTTFVSNVSHELRTPLTSIRMYAEMLEMSDGEISQAERRRHLAVIRGECGRLERLIDAVLDFANVTRGRRSFRFEFEEVGLLVRSVFESFRDQAESLGFQMQIEVEPDLPEVRLDADAMRQVLLNLLSNAVKYSDAERWIAVRAFRGGAEVALQVEDHGIGIPASEHERIFEDFYRVDQRLSSGRQGVGLGLTLVRRIVEAHGGRTTVDSAPGRGSCFTVWLPVDAAESPSLESPGGRITAGA